MNKDDIARILIDQQSEFLQLLDIHEISRDFEQDLESLLPQSSIKVVLGVRRAGKSTLVARVLRSRPCVYVNFDDERWVDLETQDLQTLALEMRRLQPEAEVWFFDEIQNVPKWELFLGRLFRERRNLIITGSNGKLLGKDLATHLTGRHLSLEIFPFSFLEFLALRRVTVSQNLGSSEEVQIRALFDEYFQVGGFPEVLRGATGWRYLRELFDRIISRDLVQRYHLRQSRGLKELALFLMNNVGQRFTYHKLAHSLGFKSVSTVKNYVGYLAEGYLLFELEPFSFKVKERISLPRKIYAIDTGLIEALNRKMTPDLGSRLENSVFLQLRRMQLEFSYFKGDTFEVDFVIHQGRRINQLIQVCYSLQTAMTFEREIKGLVQGAEALKCKNLLLLTYNEEKTVNQGAFEIEVLPVWKWLLRIGKLGFAKDVKMLSGVDEIPEGL